MILMFCTRDLKKSWTAKIDKIGDDAYVIDQLRYDRVFQLDSYNCPTKIHREISSMIIVILSYVYVTVELDTRRFLVKNCTNAKSWHTYPYTYSV